MITNITDFMDAVKAAEMVRKLPITDDRKLAILMEIRNTLPEWAVAMHFKETAVTIRELFNGWIDELNRKTSDAKSDQKAEGSSKAKDKAA